MRYDAGPAGAERLAERRLGDGTGDQVAVLPQRDVDGPVVARRLGELAGAVERVDDPHPARGEAGLVVGRLLGQHRVVGPVLGQDAVELGLGGGVAGVLEGLALQARRPRRERVRRAAPRPARSAAQTAKAWSSSVVGSIMVGSLATRDRHLLRARLAGARDQVDPTALPVRLVEHRHRLQLGPAPPAWRAAP